MQVDEPSPEEQSEDDVIPEVKIIRRPRRKTIPAVMAEQSETIDDVRARILKIEAPGVTVGFLIKYLPSIYKS